MRVLFYLLLFSLSPVWAEPIQVLMQTNRGDIQLELYPDRAPITVKNFIHYVDSGFYNGTIFHRVIPNFMIQGGGYTVDLQKKPTEAPIKNEASNGLKNDRGTIAMARTRYPHSATSQFFINVKDNDFLNPGRGAGYAVFGKVVKGMEVVDAISTTPTKVQGMMKNLPVEPVIIESMRRIEVNDEKG